MRWTRRRVATVTTWVVVVAWVVLYAVALANADPLPPAENAVAQLAVPPLLWVVAARLVLRRWWSAADSRMSGWTRRGGCSRPRWRRSPNADASGVGR
jgi:hypothetical protein